jgi:hypothetical protein
VCSTPFGITEFDAACLANYWQDSTWLPSFHGWLFASRRRPFQLLATPFSAKRTYEMICFYFIGWADEEELLAQLQKLKAPNA